MALSPGLGGLGVSRLPLSLMNRLNKPESDIFKLWMLYFRRFFLSHLFLLTHSDMNAVILIIRNGVLDNLHYIVIA